VALAIKPLVGIRGFCFMFCRIFLPIGELNNDRIMFFKDGGTCAGNNCI
jgi:hypothetical protein